MWGWKAFNSLWLALSPAPRSLQPTQRESERERERELLIESGGAALPAGDGNTDISVPWRLKTML